VIQYDDMYNRMICMCLNDSVWWYMCHWVIQNDMFHWVIQYDGICVVEWFSVIYVSLYDTLWCYIYISAHLCLVNILVVFIVLNFIINKCIYAIYTVKSHVKYWIKFYLHCCLLIWYARNSTQTSMLQELHPLVNHHFLI
jgi:hypothetical protein